MKNYSNIGMIHGDCADDRLAEFQKENPNPDLKGSYFVKARFVEGENHEWMWVSVKFYDEETKEIKGTLANDPVVIRQLKHGDPVEVNYSKVCEIIT